MTADVCLTSRLAKVIFRGPCGCRGRDPLPQHRRLQFRIQRLNIPTAFAILCACRLVSLRRVGPDLYSAATSKLMGVLYVKELQRKMEAEGVPIIVMAVHPGIVNTGIAHPIFTARTVLILRDARGRSELRSFCRTDSFPPLHLHCQRGLHSAHQGCV